MIRPIAKLPHVPAQVRAALKLLHINTSDQLLAAAAKFGDRAPLALAARIAPARLTELVRRADLARVRGTGCVFSQMLVDLDITDVSTLAEQDPILLHKRLQDHNAQTRIARRSPTAAEVADWIHQARRLPHLVTYGLHDSRLTEAGSQMQRA